MSSSARRRKSTASTNPDTVETPQLSVPGSSRMRTPTTSARSDTSPARPTSPRASRQVPSPLVPALN
ncbi:hypothetical protein FA95DRAFT_1126110 [Auriscalpium vulgare]|uniref:Uncharacterized protein n=1 Tax=Auriscalpium vulgare TaxID=40419 RepID=A0ACB8RV71_9AGAM|nr:hypothetical protein FA95DRAFT_1126110 [Auriscalpium vulgare]